MTAPSRPPLTIAFLGDSLTQGVGDETGLGWVGRLSNQLNQTWELTWYNLGVRGNTTLDLSRRVEEELSARLFPGGNNWIVLSIGTNDASTLNGVQRVPVGRAVQLAERIIETAELFGKVLWIGPVPVSRDKLVLQFGDETYAFETPRTVELSRAFADLAAERNIPFLNLVDAFAQLEVSKFETSDGIHPKSDGYEAMFEIISTWDAWRGDAWRE